MSNMQAVDPRLLTKLNRRETHSSRATLSVVAAAVLLLAVLWLAVELVLSASGNAALLISPVELAKRTGSLGTATMPGVLVGAGIALALAGIALLAAALMPGNKPRHIVENGRCAVVIDDEVLAAAISRAARTAVRLAPEQVSTSVARKRVDVAVRPGSGRSVDTEVIQHAVERELSGYGLRRPLAVAVTTSAHGAVGT